MTLVEKLGQATKDLNKFTEETGIPIHDHLIAAGHPNRPGTRLSRFQAIVVHYTANENPGATDDMNARYFARQWTGKYDDPLEADHKTPFAFGSTQMLFDDNSGSIAIPLNEVAWATGDRRLPYTPEWKGQQHIAKRVFNNSANYRTFNIEICNNDVIKHSPADWNKSVENASKFIKWTLKYLECEVDVNSSLNPESVMGPLPEGKILILRHYDITGKMCPKPMIDDPSAWEAFVRGVAA
jgi:N-acetylmuramoyl-L-alanine amidase